MSEQIVPGVDAAIKRNREVSAPLNAKWWGLDTLRVKTGHCMDCNHPRRIAECIFLYANIATKALMHIIFPNEDFGF